MGFMAADIQGFTLRKSEIVKLKRKALRMGIWFGALRLIDRALVDALLIATVDNIRSKYLAKTIHAIADALGEALENQFSRISLEIGFQLACKLGKIAQGWGNASATNWNRDEDFARFFAVMHYNAVKRVR